MAARASAIWTACCAAGPAGCGGTRMDLDDILEFRTTVETRIAALAAEQRTAEELARDRDGRRHVPGDAGLVVPLGRGLPRRSGPRRAQPAARRGDDRRSRRALPARRSSAARTPHRGRARLSQGDHRRGARPGHALAPPRRCGTTSPTRGGWSTGRSRSPPARRPPQRTRIQRSHRSSRRGQRTAAGCRSPGADRPPGFRLIG